LTLNIFHFIGTNCPLLLRCDWGTTGYCTRCYILVEQYQESSFIQSGHYQIDLHFRRET
jgi:hypothetical protein